MITLKIHLYYPMRTSLFLVDTDQNIFVCGRFALPSDIHRSIIYAYHRKYLNMATLTSFMNI